ncbi:protease family c26 gamma-glutamyl hydrolase [Anaeramoeba flamelloides]|uniref:folate gamma-glutamyl hydrolase n=1 Tax=Anaeramoeba flamelloides TaxID=1746091 RepID=A0AAV7YK03_9EUKA|nr:protease family c26 gamma-glutamyl hydrolase [Anaeramoeba flamelloides]KAJ6227128.1 protease family c26 gamma-glutamyl hydrolase [Anaeramoeba flamelloides]
MKILHNLFLIFILVVLVTSQSTPIIGVVSQPSTSKLKRFGNQFIASSIVKWVSQSGAKVVPIKYDIKETDLIPLLDQMNGVVIPGGSLPVPSENKLEAYPLYQTVKTITQITIDKNKKGEHFPVFAISESMSMVLMAYEQTLQETIASQKIASGSQEDSNKNKEQMGGVLAASETFIYPISKWPLNKLSKKIVFEGGAPESKMFGGVSPLLITKLDEHKSWAHFYGKQSITTDNFYKMKSVWNDFNIMMTLPTNKKSKVVDPANNEPGDMDSNPNPAKKFPYNKISIVAAVEGNDVPILGTLWHPAHNAWEWGKKQSPVCREYECIKVTQVLASNFVQQARKHALQKSEHHLNLNSGSSQLQSIMEVKKFYTYKFDNSFFESYIFEVNPSWNKEDSTFLDFFMLLLSFLGLGTTMWLFFVGLKWMFQSKSNQTSGKLLKEI